MSLRLLTGLAVGFLVSAAAAQTVPSPPMASPTPASPAPDAVAKAAPGIGTNLEHAAVQDPNATTEPNPSRFQVRVRPYFNGWLDYESSVSSFWEEIPKLVLAGLGGWWIAVRVTNRWDLAKKRNEFAIWPAQDFYHAIGKFKATRRQAEVLSRLPNPPSTGDLKRREVIRDKILEQAIELESELDAMAKVVLEDRADTSITKEQQVKRLHVAGLARVMVRNLREGIQHDRLETPEFGTPEFYLSNRVLSDPGEMLYTRALSASDREPKTDMHGAVYLRLINYRTTDLKSAAAAIAPAVRAFNAARRTARDAGRLANVGRTSEITMPLRR